MAMNRAKSIENASSRSVISKHSYLLSKFMTQSKDLRNLISTMGPSFLSQSLKEERFSDLNKFNPGELTEDVYALLNVAGIEMFFNSPMEIVTAEELVVPDEYDRPTGTDNRKPIPNDWPIGLSKGLEEVYHPPVTLLPGFEDERPEEMPFYSEVEPSSEKPWSLQELGMEAMQGLFKRDDDKFNSYLNARLIPEAIKERFQRILPLDIPVFKAILAIDDGPFWERLIEHTYPYIYASPQAHRTTYKSVFLQEWLADYLSNLEPGYISYNEVRKTSLAVSMWIFDLDIKALKPPQFKEAKTPKRNKLDDEWAELDKETCFVVDPYPLRLDLKKVVRCLNNLRNLAICYGFENYERFHCFRYARINKLDIESLCGGLVMTKRLVSLTIHNSGFYSQDMVVLANGLIDVPLKKLVVSTCLVGDDGAMALAKLLKEHKFLEVLDVKRNKIGENGIYYLASSLISRNITPLRSLNLSFNIFGDIGALYMSLALSVNATLGSLILSACGIKAVGGKVFGVALKSNRSLIYIDLSCNNFNEESGKTIKFGMQCHPKIEVVDVRMCGLEEDLLKRFNEIGKAHKSFNRRYFLVKDYLKRKEDCPRYVLAEGEKKKITSKPFPSYSCPREEESGSSTESDITEICHYDKDPILPRYIKEFERKNNKKFAKQVYLRHLHKQMKKEVKKGIKKLYEKGAPLLKLMNNTNLKRNQEIIHRL